LPTYTEENDRKARIKAIEKARSKSNSILKVTSKGPPLEVKKNKSFKEEKEAALCKTKTVRFEMDFKVSSLSLLLISARIIY